MCDMNERIKSEFSCFALRLRPGEDLVESLCAYVQSKSITAASILTCVGSLKQAKVRLASAIADTKEEFICINEPVEIVSLVGTLSSLGGMHLHISLADGNGKVIGGHLTSDKAIVHTTVELVIGSCDNLLFQRKFDKLTGYKELYIASKD